VVSDEGEKFHTVNIIHQGRCLWYLKKFMLYLASKEKKKKSLFEHIPEFGDHTFEKRLIKNRMVTL
jgi:hypothetical protein